MSLDTWFPVYRFGCGWEDCPQCGAMIEQEKEAAHRSAVTWPERGLVSEWQAAQRQEVWDSGSARADVKDARARARAARMTARDLARVRRVLSPEKREEALEILEAYPLRKSYLDDEGARREWISEVWLELENPTIKVAAREKRLSLDKRIKKAIMRAQYKIRKDRQDIKNLGACIAA